MREPKVMKLLHEIREKHYEETRHLSDEEFLNSIHREAESLKKRILENKKKNRIASST